MLKMASEWGGWLAQWVKHLTLVQVMISWFRSSSPTSGFVLTAPTLEPGAWSLESGSDSVSPSLSAPPPLALPLSLSQK